MNHSMKFEWKYDIQIWLDGLTITRTFTVHASSRKWARSEALHDARNQFFEAKYFVPGVSYCTDNDKYRLWKAVDMIEHEAME